MAALSDTQIVYLKTQLGTALDEDDVQDRYNRLADTRLVVKEVLEQRLADLVSAPASFSVAGEYSQSTSDNIKTLREQLTRIIAGAAGTSGFSAVIIVPLASAEVR